jgi:hypothetical protein
MNKKLLLITSAAALLVIVLAYVFLRGNSPLSNQVTLNLSNPIATNFRQAQQLAPGKVHYYSGSAFVEYDLNTQTSKALTPLYRLPTVHTVKWSPRGAIFKATNYSYTDQLYHILRSRNLPTDSIYWWSVNFQTGQLNLLGHPTNRVGVEDVVWSTSGDTFYYLEIVNSEHDPRNNLYQASLTNPGGQLLANTKALNLIWANNERIIYRSLENGKKTLTEFSLNAKSERKLFDNRTENIVVNRDGTVAAFLAPPNLTGDELDERIVEPNGPLTYLKFSDAASTTVADDFTGVPTFSSTGNQWAVLSQSSQSKLNDRDLTGYIVSDSGKVVPLTVKLPIDFGRPSTTRIVGYENGQLVIVDERGQAYLAAKELPSLKPLQSLSELKSTVRSPDKYTIMYDSSTNTYNVQITTSPAAPQAKAVMDHFRSLSLDPYQLPLKWYVNNPNESLGKGGE